MSPWAAETRRVGWGVLGKGGQQVQRLGGEGRGGKRLWPLELREAQPSSYRDRLAGQVDRRIPGRAPCLPWFPLHPQSLAQKRHTITDDSVDGPEGCGPTNTGAYVIFPP